MQFLVIGGVLALVSGQHVRADGIGDVFPALAHARPLGIPLPVFIFAALVVVLGVVMSRTVFGRHVYAIGGDIEAARRAGIKVARTGIATYAISGAFAALSGVLIASLVGHLDPTAIGGYEFPALTAVVLGGTSLTGGIGRPADTAAAILVIAVITNVMTILNYQYPIQLLVQGDRPHRRRRLLLVAEGGCERPRLSRLHPAFRQAAAGAASADRQHGQRLLVARQSWAPSPSRSPPTASSSSA